MIYRLLITVVIASLPLLSSCLQRTNADLRVQAKSEDFTVKWSLVGTFGDEAPSLPNGADPWETKYAPGQFRQISGLCATSDEVWVCDMMVSRVQVFDFNGNYLREIGQGNALDGLQPSDVLLYEQHQFGEKEKGSWEKEHGRPWFGSEGELFKAADVCVVPEGFWLVDQARTKVDTRTARGPGYYLVTPDGIDPNYKDATQMWPDFLAVNGDVVACADGFANHLSMSIPGTTSWKTKSISEKPSFNIISSVMYAYADKPLYQRQLQVATKASTTPGQFNHLGGIAFAFDKLVACDGGNQRLQVYEARSDPAAQWGMLQRIIPAYSARLGQRFELPIDIDITEDGLLFILDGARSEVALLNPRFERIGSFGLGELCEPHAIDLSDDGRHCFITDSALNRVFHYAVSD